MPSLKSSPLTGQLQRAAISVPSNIAEGAGRRTRADHLRHLSIANGSLKELETQLLLAERLGLVPASESAATLVLASDVGRMLAGLIRSLKTSARRDPAGGGQQPVTEVRDRGT